MTSATRLYFKMSHFNADIWKYDIAERFTKHMIVLRLSLRRCSANLSRNGHKKVWKSRKYLLTKLAGNLFQNCICRIMLTCVDKFDIGKSTDRIAKYHAQFSHLHMLARRRDSTYCSTSTTSNHNGVVPQKCPEWTATAVDCAGSNPHQYLNIFISWVRMRFIPSINWSI